MKTNDKKFTWVIILIVVFSITWKTVLLLWERFPFNADEAIVGLMARHILQGQRPVFFYGQVYMGGLDAYLVAGGFMLFGSHVWVIRLVQMVLYGFTVLTTLLIVRNAGGNMRALMVSGLLLAFPTVNMTLYTTISLGGYGEALLIGNLLILLVQSATKPFLERSSVFIQLNWLPFFFWGLLSGLGIWVNGITLVYIIPTGAAFLWFIVKKRANLTCQTCVLAFLCSIAGLILGALPYWIYGFQNGWSSLVGELFGSAVAIESGGAFQKLWQHTRNFILLGIPVIFGIRPPWAVKWLVLPLIPLVLSFWGWVLWQFKQIIKTRQLSTENSIILLGIPFVLVCAFVFSSFGIDPSGRYFLPINVILAVIGGVVIARMKQVMQITCILLLVAFHIIGTLQCAEDEPGMLTTQFYAPTIIDHQYDQELLDFLTANQLFFGYTNYWTAYPMAFLSDEKVVYLPRLPYHLDLRYTERDDRIQAYHSRVSAAENVSYITTNNPSLDDYLYEMFSEMNIKWQEKKIGDYRIFFGLSLPVRPDEIGLGVTQ